MQSYGGGHNPPPGPRRQENLKKPSLDRSNNLAEMSNPEEVVVHLLFQIKKSTLKRRNCALSQLGTSVNADPMMMMIVLPLDQSGESNFAPGKKEINSIQLVPVQVSVRLSSYLEHKFFSIRTLWTGYVWTTRSTLGLSFMGSPLG